MSSNDPVLAERYVGRLEDRLLDLGSDLESDDSVYYDVDSSDSSPDLYQPAECPLSERFNLTPITHDSDCLECEVGLFSNLNLTETPSHNLSNGDLINDACYDDPILLDNDYYHQDDYAVSEDEDNTESKSKLKRCSSLKSPSVSKDSPHAKKIVRFADVLGLDLADVRTYLDEVPKIPKSAFKDLEGVESPVGSPNTVPEKPQKTLIPLFQQPNLQSNFFERLNANKVILESASVTDPALFAVTGCIRVVNLDFHKLVFVRYSTDNWKTSCNLTAKYVDGSSDGFSDRFRFTIFAHTLGLGQRLEFAIGYRVLNTEYWDNNHNANYVLQCVVESVQPRTVLSPYASSPLNFDSWNSFY